MNKFCGDNLIIMIIINVSLTSLPTSISMHVITVSTVHVGVIRALTAPPSSPTQ